MEHGEGGGGREREPFSRNFPASTAGGRGRAFPALSAPRLPRPLGGGVGQGVGELSGAERGGAGGRGTRALELPHPAHRSTGQMMKHSAFLGPFYRLYDSFNLISEFFLIRILRNHRDSPTNKAAAGPRVPGMCQPFGN